MTDYTQLAIPASLRLKIYLVFSLVGIAIGGIQVGYSTAELPQPLWLKISVAVFSFLGVAVGYTAASHVPSIPTAVVDPPIVNNQVVDNTAAVNAAIAPPIPVNAQLNQPPVIIAPKPPVIPTGEGGFVSVITLIGAVFIIVGLLSLVGLFHLGLVIAIFLTVIGVLLVGVGYRSGTLR
jgi:hypothetical protein